MCCRTAGFCGPRGPPRTPATKSSGLVLSSSSPGHKIAASGQGGPGWFRLVWAADYKDGLLAHLELIRERVLQPLVDDRNLSRRHLAELVGCNISTMHKFIQGGSMSSALAVALVSVLPELEGIACPCCGEPLRPPRPVLFDGAGKKIPASPLND